MGYKIGVDLGGTNIAVGVCDDEYNLIKKISDKTQSEKGFDFVTDTIAELCNSLISELDGKTIDCIGIGSPGACNSKTGEIIFAGNLHWNNVPLAKTVAMKTGIQDVFLGNDANCAALGEFVVGAAEDFTSACLVTIGTGVGSGIIINNKLFAPENSAAPELGHIVLNCNGLPCSCGRNGCFESYASFTALIKAANIAADENPESLLSSIRIKDKKLNGKSIFDAYKAGDKTAEKIIDDFIYYMGQGLANVANLIGSECIIIGGGISKEGEWLTNRIYDLVKSEMFCGEQFAPTIKMASLGNDAGIIGAAALSGHIN